MTFDQIAALAAAGAPRNEARRLMNIDLHSSLSLDTVTDRMRMLGTRYEALRSQEPTQLRCGCPST